MIRLVYSNRFDSLAEAFAEAVTEEREHDPLAVVDLVVANPAHHDALRLHVARKHGGWGAVRARHLRSFLSECVVSIAGIVPMDASAWTRRVACVLANALDPDDPLVAPLVAWLGDDSDGRRAFELAGRLGRLFDEYSLSRLDLVAAWANGDAWPPAERSCVAGLEPWQRALWTRALGLGSETEKPLHDGILAMPAATPDTVGRRGDGPQSPVHLFAVSAGGSRPVIEALRRIAVQRDVHVYAFNPCLEYWEDLDTRYRLGPGGVAHASSWARREGVQRSLDLDLDDPFGLIEAGDTPLLRLLGRPGREVVRLMNALTDCDFEPRFARADAPDESLLRRLQTDVLERQPEPRPVTSGHGRCRDGSMVFVPAPHARAEMESIATRIRRDLDESPDAGRTYAILVPEGARERYLPLAAEALAAVGVPATVFGERLVDTSPIARLARDLLAWLGGRMNRADLRRIMLSDVLVDAGGGIAEAAERWLDELHVVVGDVPVSAALVAEGADLRQIDRAMTRAGWAAFIDPGASHDRAADIEFVSGRGPLASFVRAAADPETASRVVRIVRRLVADRDELRAGVASMPMHARRIARFFERHIVAEGGAALESRVRCVQAIHEVADAFEALEAHAPLTAPLDAVLDRFTGAIDGLEHRSGGRIDGGVVVGPMDTLRGLPFGVIHVVGLDAGVVPRPTRGDPLDVRTARRVAGDVTPSERERYRFLEALLAARHRFVVSWVDRDPSSGEMRPPSALIDELRWVVRGHIDATTLESLHEPAPSAPWDPVGLVASHDAWVGADAPSDHRPLPASLRDIALVAAAQRVSPDEWPASVVDQVENARSFVRLPRPPARDAVGVIEVRLADLVRYLCSPLQATARVALGLREEAMDDEEDVVPLTLGRDTSRSLDDAVQRRISAGDDHETAVRRAWRDLCVKGAAPPGPFGEAALRRFVARTRAIDDALAEVGLPIASALRSIHVGRPDHADDPGEVVPAIVLDVPLNDGSNVCVRLVGTTPLLTGDTLLRTRRRRTSTAEKTVLALRDLPRLVVAAAALEVSGRRIRRVLSIPVPLDEGDADRVAFHVDFDADSARSWLTDLTAGLLSGFDAKRRPIELAMGHAGLGSPRDAELDLGALEDKLMRSGRLSDAWGPIEDPTSFERASKRDLEVWTARALGPVIRAAHTCGPASRPATDRSVGTGGAS